MFQQDRILSQDLKHRRVGLELVNEDLNQFTINVTIFYNLLENSSNNVNRYY